MALDSTPDQPQDLRDFLRVLWRRRWLVLFISLAIPVTVYTMSASARKSYEATAITQIQPAAVDTTLFGAGPSTPQTGAIAATAQMVKSPRVAADAAARLPHRRPEPSLKDLTSAIAVTTKPDEGFVTITARSLRPERAAAIANAFAGAVVSMRSEQARRQVTNTIRTIARQLANLPATDRTGRSQLSDQLQRLRALAAAQGNNAILIQPATAPDSPASPKPIRNTALALVLGIALALAVAFVLDRLDRRIRRPEELRDLTGLPLLSVVPTEAMRSKHVPLHENEAIQTLRTNLTYFNVSSAIDSIIVTSPQQGEGKTTVAVNLAISVAHSGKDVILVDADLRRSELATRMGLEHSADNLGTVLAHSTPILDRALREVPTEAGRLRVLLAGSTVPNPSELMSSERMRHVLRLMRASADMVIIDSTPVLPVSDIVPLLHEVSGIVLLARMKRTTRESVERVQDVVRLSDGTILGVVATAGSSEPGGYGYGYGYGKRQRRGSRAPTASIAARDPKPGLMSRMYRGGTGSTSGLEEDSVEATGAGNEELPPQARFDGGGDIEPERSLQQRTGDPSDQ